VRRLWRSEVEVEREEWKEDDDDDLLI